MTTNRQPRTEIVGTKLSTSELEALDQEILRQGFLTRSAGVRAIILGVLAAMEKIREGAV